MGWVGVGMDKSRLCVLPRNSADDLLEFLAAARVLNDILQHFADVASASKRKRGVNKLLLLLRGVDPASGGDDGKQQSTRRRNVAVVLNDVRKSGAVPFFDELLYKLREE